MARSTAQATAPRELPAHTEQLSLIAPSWVTSPEEKILWALWMTGGEQCFCNLVLLTELDHSVVVDTIRRLSGSKRVAIRRADDAPEGDPRTLIQLL